MTFLSLNERNCFEWEGFQMSSWDELIIASILCTFLDEITILE